MDPNFYIFPSPSLLLLLFRRLASHNRDIPVDTLLSAEREILVETLEKEKYKRKHCVQQIQELQRKLLETQQQLAVAVSIDRKKDVMIEQLDKTLKKLVDGWKENEAQKRKKIIDLEARLSQSLSLSHSLSITLSRSLVFVFIHKHC